MFLQQKINLFSLCNIQNVTINLLTSDIVMGKAANLL